MSGCKRKTEEAEMRVGSADGLVKSEMDVGGTEVRRLLRPCLVGVGDWTWGQGTRVEDFGKTIGNTLRDSLGVLNLRMELSKTESGWRETESEVGVGDAHSSRAEE